MGCAPKFCSKRCYERDRYKRKSTQIQARMKLWRDTHPERARAHARKALRNRDLKVYGLTVQSFNEMLAAQDGRCLICGEVPKRTPHVDHCHETGLVRGLLCSKCNTALGLLDEDPARCQRAALYLENFVARMRREAMRQEGA